MKHEAHARNAKVYGMVLSSILPALALLFRSFVLSFFLLFNQSIISPQSNLRQTWDHNYSISSSSSCSYHDSPFSTSRSLAVSSGIPPGILLLGLLLLRTGVGAGGLFSFIPPLGPPGGSFSSSSSSSMIFLGGGVGGPPPPFFGPAPPGGGPPPGGPPGPPMVFILRSTSAASREYLHFRRMTWPYLYSKNGKGTHISARKPGTELAQWMPRLANIWDVNNGKAAPKRDRRILLAARTLAAYRVYASMR